ncbi:MAG: short-chain dehydrogenase [Hyphomicrobiales bacterium]|nr:MAG: short-chain dehydrogenase [Hyphomicrobiales bacterium]
MTEHSADKRSGGIPRGIATDGPAVLSYGFRPFFLVAGIFALIAMPLWIAALVLGWPIGGALYGPVWWHGHEMLFGYAVAPLAGFLLTTIPNWTGRLPVSGIPLLGLVALWAAGRFAMAFPDGLGIWLTATLDGAFLPVFAVICAREIIAGKNWKNLKVAAVLSVLALINLGFHLAVATGGDASLLFRAGIAVFVVLIGIVGGRIVPSFTRNWLVKQGAVRLPIPFGRYDVAAMVVLIAALSCWTVLPHGLLTAALAAVAALAHAYRLLRWRGLAAAREPMLAVLHLGYGFVPAGLVAIGLAALDLINGTSALHILTVGAISNMTLAVMTRATLGHTGRPINASPVTLVAFAALFLAAAVRPFAEIAPDHYLLVLGLSGIAWMIAFSLYTIEYGAMLLRPRAGRKAASSPVPGTSTFEERKT